MAKIIEVTNTVTKEEKKSFHGSGFYRGENRCTKLRQHSLDFQQEKNWAYDTAVAEKDIIRMYFKDDADISEIGGLVSQGIEDKFKCQEVTRDVLRYLKSEKRTPIMPEAKYFLVNGEKVRIMPDLIFDDGNTLEVVFIRTGRPDVKLRGRKQDQGVHSCLELWYGTIYGRSIVKDGETRDIRACYYYLRKETDRATGPYDFDFFSKQGGNVVYLEEKGFAGGKESASLDAEFLPQLEEFREGTECSDANCEFCPNKVACSYQKAPDVFERKSNDAKKKAVVYSDAQEKVIGFRDGKCRVIAKAGTGKTECTTERGARMYAEGMDPHKMLFVTFTDAGAIEMKERLIAKSKLKNLTISSDDIPAMTFHTLGYGFIKDNYEYLGFEKMPSIIDTNAARKGKLIHQVLDDAQFFTMENRYNALDWAIKCFDTMKTAEIDPDDFDAGEQLKEAISGNVRMANAMSSADYAKMIDMYKEYKRICDENCWLTFSDIEPLMNRILRELPEYLESLGYEHIIVDEFQDSNDAQMETIKHLIGTKCFKSLMVVGDDCQSIYGFRNTSQENILYFWEKLGVTDGKDLYLLENRRSTPEILSFADEYISTFNEEQSEEHMQAVREHGFKPIVRGFWEKDDERKFIVDQIKACHNKGGYAYEDMAIIGATRAELVNMAAALSDAGIPWITKYPMQLLENSRVQAAISLGMAFYQPEAENLYFNYVIAKNDGDIFEDMTNEEIKDAVKELKDEWMGMDFMDIPYQRKLFHDKLEAIRGNDEIYAYFLELLYENEDLQSELEYIVDFRRFGEKVEKKLDQSYAGVVLTTAHSSKGLEWPIVFNTITGYDSKYLHTGRNRHAEVEEKRRLLYVSMTRARDYLYLTGRFVAYGQMGDYTYNQFLKELFEIAKGNYNPAGAQSEAQAKKAAAKAKASAQTMTDAEVADYERRVKNAKQMTLADLTTATRKTS